MTTPDLLDSARSLQQDTVALRRRLHRHPELGLELPRTRAAVLEALDGLPLELTLAQRSSGLVATLHGARRGNSVLLRGDMDALPMPEHTGLDYASEVEGRMHACGHDAHTAMLASAARLLAARREQLAGSVRFLFQPGEEGHFGARSMLEEGLLETDGLPDAAFALHVYPQLPAGTVGCRAGPLWASCDRVSIRVVGRGGHSSTPSAACDPVPIACHVVTALQTLVTRRVPVFDPTVLTIGQIRAGTTFNVIPETAELHGMLRTLSPQTRATMHDGIRRTAEHTAQAHGARAEVTLEAGYPATVNDDGVAAVVERTTRTLLGADAYRPLPHPIMGAEDFSYILQRVPGAMALLGVGTPGQDPGAVRPCHSSHMTLHEDAMAVGAALHAAMALALLDGRA